MEKVDGKIKGWKEREWDVPKIQNIFSPIIAKKIIRTPISKIAKQDNLISLYRQDGDYTVKTGYHIAKKEEEKKS
ncbi:hypothetical protein Ahy_A07g031710 [Arachis hypogaea]|uniref:Uncharacterized protein n=1 Tax=Arachis hypogaea TaxID=3818 RepID=A0A445C4Y1_ARAHY|nr:hypothetical protein Ahy_A07g031710 [Arachis hypogaea]